MTPYRANKSDHTKRDCYNPQDIDQNVANITRVAGTAPDTEDATGSDEQASDENDPGPGEVVGEIHEHQGSREMIACRLGMTPIRSVPGLALAVFSLLSLSKARMLDGVRRG